MENKILIIDDDTDLCYLLKNYLMLENYNVTICNDGASGIKEGISNTYQLIILDIMLPIMNGFEVLTTIRKTSSVPILMLTAKDSEVDKVSGLRLGADDYLTKPFLQNEFIARVQSLIRRYTIFNAKHEESETLSFKGLAINRQLRIVNVNGDTIKLTAKEFDLLLFLASNKGQVFTKEQIYNHVWKEEYSYDDSNIMSFISKLRRKIKNTELELDYIQTIHGVGYRFNLGV
ncbi:response regulator transcription factor [Lysinibacillus sp. NPDC096418]|uniref:response regulator transcription factor n=1 Tax=Lysinibacillus sp. NPDC096418 TaxID=3364138 RepID=UPI003827872B